VKLPARPRESWPVSWSASNNMRAYSLREMRSVVSAGTTMSLILMSSQPAIEMSPGRAIPLAGSAQRTNRRQVVGCNHGGGNLRLERIFSMAADPPSMREFPSTIQPSWDERPCFTTASRNDSRRTAMWPIRLCLR